MTKPNSKTMAIVEGVIIIVAIAMAAGFYMGKQYQSHVNAQVKTEAQTMVSMSKR